MKTKIFLIFLPLAFFLNNQASKSQEIKDFPFNPLVILKSWNYDLLVKTMGNGEEIMGSKQNQTYLSGLRYPSELLGMHGNLEFIFNRDSISRFHFRKENVLKVIDPDLAGRMARDTAVTGEYNRGIQKKDSYRRDSIAQAISEILGPPVSQGPTAVSEKNARYSAIWINRGYTCQFKDYIGYSEIVFVLSTVPQWVISEFDVPDGTEVLLKTKSKTQKMSWTASLLGVPSYPDGLSYSDIFLLLEFTTAQRYLVNIPKNPISLLPALLFEDCDGDAIPEAWIRVPADKNGNHTRHYLFSVQYREPTLIFNSDEQIPIGISIRNNSQVQVTFQDGTTRTIEPAGQSVMPDLRDPMKPDGFKYLKPSMRNTDGSTNFTGGIELISSTGTPGENILEVTYRYSAGGWVADQMILVKRD